MTAQLRKQYHAFRTNPPFYHTGRNAEAALRSAKTLIRFREMEAEGKVRLRAEDEQESTGRRRGRRSGCGIAGGQAHRKEGSMMQTHEQHTSDCIWRDARDMHAGPCMNQRAFDCCAYRSKSGKTSCGSLRYYHDEPGHRTFRGHKFVEPERVPTDKEIIAALIEALKAIYESGSIKRAEQIAAEALALTETGTAKGAA